MNHTLKDKSDAIARVIETLDILRVECPWDRKQTNQSLRQNTIEEVYELCDALLNEDNPNICKELGDVLLHVLFYAKIGEEKDQFDIADVADSLNKKLIFRHPHVFGEVEAADAETVIQNWEQIKLKEKGGNKTVLGGVPRSLPALIKAERIQEKAANVGFDWKKREDVWEKVKEEVDEVASEIAKNDKEGIEAEFGDLLFAMVNAARLYGVNVENALERTNQKFIRRFNYIEDESKKAGKSLSDMTLEEMDEYWNKAKQSGL